jgi:hypothetical protein
MKKLFFIGLFLISLNSIAQSKMNNFFGKWKIVDIETKILENDSEKSALEKTAVKKLISSKFNEGNYFIVLSKNEITFFEDNKISEKYKIKSMKLVGDKLEIVFDKYKKTFIFKDKNKGELSGNGVTHSLQKV